MRGDSDTVTVPGSAHNLQGFPAGVCSVGVGYHAQEDPSNSRLFAV